MKLILTLLSAAALFAQASVTLERAIRKETLEGDLKGAIALFEKAYKEARNDRATAAKALLRLAECHQKMGDAKARGFYEQLVRDYGDQKEQVATARLKLGSATTLETRTRLLWDNAIDAWGRATADGRYLSFVDWSTGDLAIRDLVTGENRRVTNKGGYQKAEAEAERNSISPDGKRVAFAWDRWDAKAIAAKTIYSLRVIDSDGKNERVLREFPENGYVEPLGWSPDSKWLLVASNRGGQRSECWFGRVNVDTGEWKQLVVANTVWKSDAVFSPDAKWIAFTEGELPSRSSERTLKVVSVEGAPGSDVEISADAVLLGWTPDGSAIAFRRPHSEASRLYLQNIIGGRASAAPRELQMQPLGDASPLAITAKGDLVFSVGNLRTEGRIVRVGGAEAIEEQALHSFPVEPTGFANNFGNVRFSPDGKYVASSIRGNSISIRNFGSRTERVISPPWTTVRRFEWSPDAKSFLAIAIGRDKELGVYRADAETGALSLVCKLEDGRTFVPAANGEAVFHLTQTGLERLRLDNCQSEKLWPQDLSGHGPNNIRLSKDGRRLMLQTFKLLGVFDIAAGTFRELYRNRSLTDGLQLWSGDWSADGESIYVTARDRADSALNHGRAEIHIFPASGGEQKRQKRTEFGRTLALSPDGTQAAFTYRETHLQVWVMENFLPPKK